MITGLTRNGVSILTNIDGANHRRSYTNNIQGRKELREEQPPEVIGEVMLAWGMEPTIEEAAFPTSEPAGPTLEERMSNQEQATLALMDTILTLTGGNGNV